MSDDFKPSQKTIDGLENTIRELRVKAEFAEARESLKLAEYIELLEKERDRQIIEVKCNV